MKAKINPNIKQNLLVWPGSHCDRHFLWWFGFSWWLQVFVFQHGRLWPCGLLLDCLGCLFFLYLSSWWCDGFVFLDCLLFGSLVLFLTLDFWWRSYFCVIDGCLLLYFVSIFWRCFALGGFLSLLFWLIFFDLLIRVNFIEFLFCLLH